MAGGSGPGILKRLALLNRSGVLARPLPYSQVKEPLSSVAEEVALQILQDLEYEAANVTDPVQYVKSAVSSAAGGAAPAEEEEVEEEVAIGAAQKRKAPPAGRPGAPEGPIAKRLRLLNDSGQLTQPIDYGRVQEALDSLGVAQAMTILRGLQDVAADVSDPTGYIRTAVRSAGGLVPQDAEEADQEAAEELGQVPAAPAMPELRSAPWAAVKVENRPGGDLTEAEKIERRVLWLNRRGGLAKPMELSEVLPALDSIGTRQSMRVLRRLEEAGATVADPDEFVKDLVARSGWIWSKPDVIDDDEKVAKRVAWLNQFGGLSQPIDYATVADLLDGLKVAHAMVLLRELEVQAHRIDDPTDYIRKTVALAGEDDVHIPLVDQGSSIAQRVTQLNESGVLAKAVDFKEVGEGLGRLGDEAAMQLLREVELKGSSVKDPTGFIKFKLKAKLATLTGATLEEAVDDETKILKRIEWLNDYGGLLQDIDYNQVAARLASAGLDSAMAVLKDLEDKKRSVDNPTAFVIANVGPSAVRAAPARPAVAASGGAQGGADLQTLTRFVGFLNRNSKMKKPVKFSDVASAMDRLGPERAMKVLQEMQEKGLGLDDPVAYINSAALRAGVAENEVEEVDDVAKITKRLKWLNQFGSLSKKIKIDDVVGALYCLGLRQSMAILRGLQEKGAGVPDPTWYIKAAVQRANGVRVTPPPAELAAEVGAADEEVDEQPDDEEGDGAGEAEAAAGEEGGIFDFEDPEGEEDPGEAAVGAGGEAEDDPWAEFEAEADEPDANPNLDEAMPAEDAAEEAFISPKAEVVEAAPARRKRKANADGAAPEGGFLLTKAEVKERRVVGALTGAVGKLTPSRPNYGMVKSEPAETTEAVAAEETSKIPIPALTRPLPLSPQEKLLQIREYALKHGLDLDQNCLKALARLAFFKSKDLIDEVILGGRNRKGVTNPSRYLSIGCEKLTTGLGVEQGIAMELAVSLGVVLNNEALDELACIPRKSSHAIIRELSKNEEARQDAMRFIMSEVTKCRAQLDARPWPPPAT